MRRSPSQRPPLTDSPWYWLYLFATAGLVALLLMGPKYAARQAQLERNSQGRQRATQHRVGLRPATPLSAEERPQIQLWPLYLILLGVLGAAWAGLWWRHFHRSPEDAPSADEVSPDDGNSG